MELRFEMSGGYAGVFTGRPLTCVATVDELPGPERVHLRQLVEESGLLQATQSDSGPTPGRDVMTYRLSITAEGGTRHFTFDDITVPPGVRPLLQHLQQRAIAERAGGR